MSKFSVDEDGQLIALQESITEPVQQLPSGELGLAFAKMILSLLAIVILLLLSYWFIRKLIQSKMEKGSSHAAIQVIEKRVLSPKTMLYLIEVEGKKIVVAESHLEIKRLADLNQEELHS